RLACRDRAFDAAPDALGINQPVNPETVSPQTGQQEGCVSTIEIDFVFRRHDSEPREIEMRIQALERIESPGDLLYPLGQCALALRQLQLETDAQVAPRRFDRRHM